MCKLFLLPVILAVVSTSSISSLYAQSGIDCLEKIGAKLHRGESLILVKSDASKIQGWFESIDPDQSLLYISHQIHIATYGRSHYPISEIKEIKYGSFRKLRPVLLVVGFAAGAGIGAAIGSSSDRWSSSSARTGSLIGGASGLLVGLLISVAVPSMKSIRCDRK